MMTLGKIAASVLGIGYIEKGAGTVASIACCIAWAFVPVFSTGVQLFILLAVILLGLWSSTVVEKAWGHDSNKVVIDEVAGMLIVLMFVPHQWKYMLAALFLFRFFDILKPLGIKKAEALSSGWGVMADDVAAGIYALVLIRVVLALNLF